MQIGEKLAREMMEALGFVAATETKDDGAPTWGLKQLTKKVNGLHKVVDSVKEPGDKSLTRLFKDVCDELTEGNEIEVTADETEEGSEKPKAKAATKKGKGKSKAEDNGHTEDKPKAKKEKAPKQPGQPSNKEKVYRAWEENNEITAEKAEKKVAGQVKVSTIKSWISSWKRGQNLPGCATKKVKASK